MKRWLLDIICCPICKGTLIITENKSTNTEILDGVLTCTSCNRTYPISDGIADLLPDDEDNIINKR
ncbi:MAG TPA: methytransferase partner Trm112 [Methanocorpusculum sp.]|nr:methytransferase partner Trm112 [Methanocorpusculum sp.]HJJ56327.1 methytransferase partner Trm112 [Methanocorpusculum sp.]